MKLEIEVEEKDGKVIISGNEMFADYVKMLCISDEQVRKYKKWHEECGQDDDDEDITIDDIMKAVDEMDEPKEITSLTKEEVDELLNNFPILNKETKK